MQIRTLNATTVKERLRRYHQAILNNAISDLKTGKETYAWFKMTDRLSRPSDRLGLYKLMPKYTGARMDLAEKTILEVILEEFEIYHAHLRLINKKSNYGWLRNMYYSLGQQVMRQDPKYFAIYCRIRMPTSCRTLITPNPRTRVITLSSSTPT
jgi:hypothetical protein